MKFIFGESDSYTVEGFAAFEADSGSIEGIIPVQLKEELPSGVKFVDGEHSEDSCEVTYFDREIIYGDDYCKYDKTTKAQVVIAAFGESIKCG